MVTALLVGLVVGFVMVMPPGPMAMACMRQALAGRAREGVALVLGAAAMDSGCTLLVFQGGCILMLVVVGLHYCRSSRHGGAARARPEARVETRGDMSPVLR